MKRFYFLPVSVFVIVLVENFGKIRCANFKLKVEVPDNVPVGCAATLLCKYTLPLYMIYSVKWYRGSYEFYRYLPKETPPDKSFDKPGIIVQLDLSNATQVTLKNVTQALSGPFTCEVSAEEPTFITKNHTAHMHIFELSMVQKPHVRTNEFTYTVGKPFFVICSLPTYPRVGIFTTTFKMNVYQDGEKINAKSVTTQKYGSFVVAAHLLERNLSTAISTCFECEVSICGIHKTRGEKLCVPFTSDYTSLRRIGTETRPEDFENSDFCQRPMLEKVFENFVKSEYCCKWRSSEIPQMIVRLFGSQKTTMY